MAIGTSRAPLIVSATSQFRLAAQSQLLFDVNWK
jgi:hypothetical protein